MKSKLSSSLVCLEEKNVNSTMKKIIDLIDANEILKSLTSEDGEVKKTVKSFMQTTVDGKNAQILIGINYRVNVIEGEEASIMFFGNDIMYEDVKEIKDQIASIGLESEIRQRHNIKFVIKIPIGFDYDKISELFSVFNIK